LPLFDRAAIDIGTTVHHMAELDLKGRPYAEIEAYAQQCLTAPDDLFKAFTSFAAFRAWREKCHVEATEQEVSMVSETFQFGGTPDTIAMIDGGLGLIDFKTSAKPYPDHLIALAAYGRLWEEHNPQQPLSSYHLIILPKDGSAFQHHAYADLSPQWKLFRLYLEAYRIDKACAGIKPVQPAKPVLDDSDRNGVPAFLARSATVLPFAAPPVAEAAIAADAPKPRRPRKPQAAKAAPAASPATTMAELLRNYGHVPECVA
jgi:hypothetical protein